MFEPTISPQRKILIQDAGQLGHGAKRISFACSHGATARILLPGKTPLQDQVLRDLMIAVHGVETGCRCAESLHQRTYLA